MVFEKNGIESSRGYESYGLNQIGDDVQKNIFDNILQLHYLANKYYKKLEKYKENCKYKGMINKPIFYKE